MTKLRIFLNLVLLIIMLAILTWSDLVIYGIEQGYGQLKIIRNAKPVSEVLASSSTSDAVKKKLALIGEIRQFAFDSLGINHSDNYTDFYDQGPEPLLLTISACREFSFDVKEWRFPFLGRVSYKGYFNLEKARKEVLRLKAQGYDVDVYAPGGWSTLGWFRDPILSGMLKRDEGALADLIIHELTHGTLYVKNNVTFNENLASFIGDKGARRFLLQRYGKDSKGYKRYINGREDDKIYNEYILKETEKLDSLYKNMDKELPYEKKKALKTALIHDIALGVYRLPLHAPRSYFYYTLQAFQEGNAFFMTFNRYDSQYDLFDKEFREKYNSDLRLYMEALKKKWPSL